MSVWHTFDLSNAKHVDETLKDTVYGYLKQVEMLLPADNPYYNIATIIKHIILLYYINTSSFLLKSLQLTEEEFYEKYLIQHAVSDKIRSVKRKMDNKQFALKMIAKSGKSKEELEDIQREMSILVKLDHPNVHTLINWCETKKQCIYMVVPYCDGGDVFDRIMKEAKLSENAAAHLTRTVAEGLQHIHDNNIIHRDLKLDTLMYLTKDKDSDIMIIDFRLSGDCSNGPLSTECGTAHYVAPEIISSKPYNCKADMWSLGVIIYMLLCGYPPFFDAENNMKRLYELIKVGEYEFGSPYWDNISDEAKDLIKNLLILDPNKRFSATQCLNHKWINK